MISDDTAYNIIQAFREYIISPVAYMYEDGNLIQLVCVYGSELSRDEVLTISGYVSEAAGRPVEISDIREFCEMDRAMIIHDAQISYCEDEKLAAMLYNTVASDCLLMFAERDEIKKLYKENGSAYLQ